MDVARSNPGFVKIIVVGFDSPRYRTGFAFTGTLYLVVLRGRLTCSLCALHSRSIPPILETPNHLWSDLSPHTLRRIGKVF